MPVSNTPQRPKYPRRSDIMRTVAAARDAGINVGFVECLPDGVIRVGMDQVIANAAANTFDEWEAAGRL